MKKGRPGVVLAALARPADARAVAEAIVRETTALGVRMSRHERLELERRFRDVTVDGHASASSSACSTARSSTSRPSTMTARGRPPRSGAR